VGLPVGCIVRLIAEDKFKGSSVLIPELVFKPMDVFNKLKKWNIEIHEEIK